MVDDAAFATGVKPVADAAGPSTASTASTPSTYGQSVSSASFAPRPPGFRRRDPASARPVRSTASSSERRAGVNARKAPIAFPSNSISGRAARPTVCKAVADPSATAKANKAEWNKLGQVCAVLGSQWGDEGKGKLVDILAQVRPIPNRKDALTRRVARFPLPRPARRSRGEAARSDGASPDAEAALDPTLARARDAMDGVPPDARRPGRVRRLAKSANHKPKNIPKIQTDLHTTSIPRFRHPFSPSRSRRSTTW